MGKFLKQTPFEELYIQPSAGDGGGAIGAALYGYHMILGKPRRFVMQHAYWGEEHGPGETETFLKEAGVPYRRIEDDEKLIEYVVDRISQDGKVIGWSQGRFEWGPRALGNRSILADPRRADMKDIVNTKIKFREPFRPFAPSVLLKEGRPIFCIAGSRAPLSSPVYALCRRHRKKTSERSFRPSRTWTERAGFRRCARKSTSPKYYRLIEAFGEATGIPCCCSILRSI